VSDYGYDEPDGTCEECGIDLDDDADGDHDEHHRRCWSCWPGDQDNPQKWRESRPAAGKPSESVIVGLVELRRQLRALEDRIQEIEGVLDRLAQTRSRKAA
jgi:hypothetical protein